MILPEDMQIGYDKISANPSGSQGPVEDEEFNFMNTTNIGDWIKTLGAEKAEKIVRGLVDIYPAQRIVFDEPVEDEPVEDEPVEDEPVEDEPVEDEPVEDEPVEDEPVEDEPAIAQPVDYDGGNPNR